MLTFAALIAAGLGLDGGVRAQSLQARTESILKQVGPSVVTLWFGEEPRSHATGTIVSPEGLILTCEHISVKVGGELEVHLDDGRIRKGRLLSKLTGGKTEKRDVALAEIVGGGTWPAVELGTAKDLSGRDVLLSIGYGGAGGLYSPPGGEPPRQIHLGRRVVNDKVPAEILATTIRGSGGDSGGPVFDLGGRLVGLLSGGGSYLAHNYYVTADLILRDWEELAGDRPRPSSSNEARPVLPSPGEETAAAVEEWRDSVVEVRSDDRWTGIGVVVGRGLILTKASELGPNLTVVLKDDIPALARLAATDPDRDLALLRMPAADMTDTIRPVEWAESDDVAAGALVAYVTPRDFHPPAGVVSVPADRIPPMRGGLAVMVKEAEGGVEVVEPYDQLNRMWLRPSPLELRVGDVITDVGGEKVPDRAAYLRRFQVDPDSVPRLISGDLVDVVFRRDGATHAVRMRLRPGGTPSYQLVWPFSYRYTGFARAFACDMPARPEHCGALVVDSKGRCVGVLVAQAAHVYSLAIPARDVRDSLMRMRRQIDEGL